MKTRVTQRCKMRPKRKPLEDRTQETVTIRLTGHDLRHLSICMGYLGAVMARPSTITATEAIRYALAVTAGQVTGIVGRVQDEPT